MEKYVTKITADGDNLAWLRPVATETHLMTVAGVVREGWAEASPLGGYVRWTGTFQAKFAPRPDRDGVISDNNILLTSNRLILPAVAANFLGEYFQRSVVEVGQAKADPLDKSARNRTGEYFLPREGAIEPGLPGVVFAIDLLLQPPKEGKPSNTGYQFGAVIRMRPTALVLPAKLLEHLGEGQPLLAGKTADVPPADDEAAQNAAA